MHGGRNIAPIKLTQTLERSRDRATHTLILTYLGLISKTLDDICESQGLQTNSQRPCLSMKLKSEK